MTANTNAFVIVGAGQAGAQAAQTLREEGFDGPLVLIGEETERPYERPPLSKGYLLGSDEREKIYVHPESWYAEHDVDLRLGTAVTALDPAAHEITLADGSRTGYAKLLLATGSSPRPLPVPGADLAGVHYLRRAEDSDRLKEAFRTAVQGGGGRRRLDRPGDRCRRPRRRRRGHRAGERRAAAAASARSARSPRSSPTCTATTASTCAAASRSPRSPAPAARRTASC